MKAEVVETSKKFTPFTITLTIESEQELCDLWYRTESAPHGLVYTESLVYEADNVSCTSLFNVLDQKVEQYNLTRVE